MTAAADPAHGVAAVTVDVDIPRTCRALYVGSAGNVEIVASDGTTAVFIGVQAGTVLPVRARRVVSGSTTATNIVALI